MSKVVLDSSAVLAALQKEAGGDLVLSRLRDATISAVNFAEVVSKLAASGGDLTQILSDLHELLPDVRSFETDQATATGQLAAVTRAFGLSLGDRACLALAKSLGVPALTTDQAWTKLDIGVAVELIRGTPS